MVKSILQSLFTKALVACINFCILIVSAKYLGVSSRGEISIFILNVSIIQAVSEIYTGYSLIHFLPKLDLRGVVTSGLAIIFISCTIIYSLIVFLDQHIEEYFWLGYIVSILIVWNTFNCVILLGKEQFKLFNSLSIIQPLVLFSGILIFVLFKKTFTFEAYLFPLLMSFSLATLISSYNVLKKIRLQTERNHESLKIKPILFNGLLYQANFLMFIFCNRFSFYFLNTKADVGIYSSASMIMESVLIIANGITPILITKIANRKTLIHETLTTLSLAKLSLFFSLLGIALLLVLPEPLYLFFLGQGFIGIKKLMFIYSPSVVMASFFLILSAHFSALGKQKFVFATYLPAFLITIILTPVLVQKYETIGAAYSSLISYAIMLFSLISLFMVKNKVKFKSLFDFKFDLAFIKSLIN